MSPEHFFKTHTRLTRSLKKFIADYQEQLDGDTFSAFLQTLSEEISARADAINTVPQHADRARKLHQMVEEETAQGNDIPVSCRMGCSACCRMGCSACCHMEVEVTSYEAEILKGLVESGHPIDRERLQRQSQRSLQDPTWKQGPRNLDSKCVFLNSEGACSIYEHRPVMCRRHSVTSPAKNCETLDAPITIRYFPRVDLLISAANEDTNMQIGPMAKMLEMALTR